MVTVSWNDRFFLKGSLPAAEMIIVSPERQRKRVLEGDDFLQQAESS